MSNQEPSELKDKLAAIEHQRWADWQEWCNSQIRENANDFESVLGRWDKQIATPYYELSDKEKASDMEQVDRYWPLIEDYIDRKVAEALEAVVPEKHPMKYMLVKDAAGKTTDKIEFMRPELRGYNKAIDEIRNRIQQLTGEEK